MTATLISYCTVCDAPPGECAHTGPRYLADSLSVVKLQAEELVFDGLDLSSLNPDDLIELRRREPDWTPWGRT